VKPRVVIVDASTGVTGGLKAASRMARLLKPWASFTLVLPRESNVTGPELEAFNEVVRLPIVPLRRSLISAVTYVPALLAGGFRLRRLLAQERAVALVINDFYLMHGVVARLLGYRGRLLTWVRFDPARFPGALSRAWLAAGRRASDALVAVSEFIRTRLSDELKSELIYDVIDLELPVGGAGSGPRLDIIFVGNYVRGKGQDHAIEAFRHIADRFPETCLVFHGGDLGLEKNRSYRRDLERRVDEYGLCRRVFFGGFVDDLEPVFAKAVVALNLSESESFSFTCLEASQCGVPVIAFRSGGPQEIIEHGVTGFLFDIGNIAQVADALSNLLGNPRKASTMGQAAARHVSTKFGAAAYVGAVRRLLNI
jgi:glycosyltransferase involved in cell wall biosynthesis